GRARQYGDGVQRLRNRRDRHEPRRGGPLRPANGALGRGHGEFLRVGLQQAGHGEHPTRRSPRIGGGPTGAAVSRHGGRPGGAGLAPAVQVTAQDAQGNVATAFSGSVTVALGANPGGGTLVGTATVTAMNGVASFSGLSVNKAGSGYTLTAAATGLRTSTSALFSITVGAL